MQFAKGSPGQLLLALLRRERELLALNPRTFENRVEDPSRASLPQNKRHGELVEELGWGCPLLFDAVDACCSGMRIGMRASSKVHHQDPV